MRTIRKRRVVSAFTLLMVLAGTLAPLAYSGDPEAVIRITAKRFEYSPNEIRLKKGVPVVLEFTSLDRLHGFSCPDLGIRTDIPPGKTSRVRVVPDKVGTFPFHCDIFCGEGHEDMTGKFVVTD